MDHIHATKLSIKQTKYVKTQKRYIIGSRKTLRSKLKLYVPGTTASIQGELGPVEGGWVVVSWVPLRRTSVDLAASQPESSFVFPRFAAIETLGQSSEQASESRTETDR